MPQAHHTVTKPASMPVHLSDPERSFAQRLMDDEVGGWGGGVCGE